MKFPKFKQTTDPPIDPTPVPAPPPPPSESPPAESSTPPAPAPAPAPDTVLPFDGVPAPPAEVDPSPVSATLPEGKQKRRFLRLKPSRKTSSQTPSSDVSSAFAPPSLDQPPPPPPLDQPPPPPPPSQQQQTLDPRQDEKEDFRRRRKFLEGITGQNISDSDSEPEEANSVDEATAAAEGKPSTDAVASPIDDPPPPPPLPAKPSQTSTHTYAPLADYDAYQPPVSPPPAPPAPPAPPSENASQMAEMFASRAFGAPSAQASPFPSQPPPLVPPAPSAAPSAAPSFPPTGGGASRGPVGWGNVMHTMPTVPHYGPPAHLTSSTARGPIDLDPGVSDKLRRGRELAVLAIQQEEQSNLPAAEAAYIKALSLLIPASRELDVGPDLTAHLRRTTKSAVQRESAALLTRCEHIRTLIRASGPSVPSQMPPTPHASTLAPPAPPPPPASDGNGQQDLLSRIANLSVTPGRPDARPTPPPFPKAPPPPPAPGGSLGGLSPNAGPPSYPSGGPAVPSTQAAYPPQGAGPPYAPSSSAGDRDDILARIANLNAPIGSANVPSTGPRPP